MQLHTDMSIFLKYKPKFAIFFAVIPLAYYPGFAHNMDLIPLAAWPYLNVLKYIFISNNYFKILNYSFFKSLISQSNPSNEYK